MRVSWIAESFDAYATVVLGRPDDVDEEAIVLDAAVPRFSHRHARRTHRETSHSLVSRGVLDSEIERLSTAMDTLGELDVANKCGLTDVVDRLAKPDHAAVRTDEPVELTCADHEARIVLMHRRHQLEYTYPR